MNKGHDTSPVFNYRRPPWEHEYTCNRNGVFAQRPGCTHISRSTRSGPLGQDRRLGRSAVRLSIPVCCGTAYNRRRSSRPTNRNCQISVLDLTRPCFARDADRQTLRSTEKQTLRDNETRQLHDEIIFDKRPRIMLSNRVLSHYQLQIMRFIYHSHCVYSSDSISPHDRRLFMYFIF